MRLPVQEQRREAAGFPGVVRLAGDHAGVFPVACAVFPPVCGLRAFFQPGLSAAVTVPHTISSAPIR